MRKSLLLLLSVMLTAMAIQAQTGWGVPSPAKSPLPEDSLSMLYRDSARFEILPVNFNTGEAEFGPMYYQQGLLFSKPRQRFFLARFLSGKNGGFFDLYYAPLKTGGNYFGEPEALKGSINKKYHEGPVTLNKSQDLMYLTRTIPDKPADKYQKRSLGLFSSQKMDGKWKNVVPLAVNNKEFNVAHPALGADDKVLYFASDIPERGYGGSDIYVMYKTGDGWSAPQNLGPAVNTAGNEKFPFVHENGNLYFASDGHPGIGGLDVFVTYKEGNEWSKPVNMGYPVNTSANDFSLILSPDQATGYFTSDRSGNSDIYHFRQNIKIDGILVDEITKAPVPDARIEMMDINSKQIFTMTDQSGKFSFYVKPGQAYFFKANKDDYLEAQEKLSAGGNFANGLQYLKMEIEPELKVIAAGNVLDTNKVPVEDAEIMLVSEDGETIVYSDDKGDFFQHIREDQNYSMYVHKKGFIPYYTHFSTKGFRKGESVKFDVVLEEGQYDVLTGTISRIGEGIPLVGANVRLIDNDKIMQEDILMTNADGKFLFILKPETEYSVVATKQFYISNRTEFETPEDEKVDTFKVNLVLDPIEMNKIVKVIYYDYDKSFIRKEASKDLKEIVIFLKDNPDLQVELSSHTDSRGSASYNKQLSKKRATSAVKFIQESGIEENRIRANWFGESSLVNECEDGVPCSEEKHQENRRTDLRIIAFEANQNKKMIKTNFVILPKSNPVYQPVEDERFLKLVPSDSQPVGQ